jgi:hypothetical protein
MTDEQTLELEACRNYRFWRLSGKYCFSKAKVPDPDNPGTLRIEKRHMPLDEYNAALTAMFSHRAWKRIAIPKTRQMKLTWEVCAYLLHYAMFNPGSENIVFVKKGDEGGGGYLIEDRINYMWEQQPEFLKDFCKAELSRSEVRFSNGTFIRCIPQGEAQAQMYQCMNMYFDECAWYDGFLDMLESAMPMAERIILTSTSNGKTGFSCIVHDREFNRMAA